MLTIALDAKNTEMRLNCSSGLSHEDITAALQVGSFRFQDLGAYIVIQGTLDWKSVLTALGIDSNKAVKRGRDDNVFTVTI
jgi:hypothetical protein